RKRGLFAVAIGVLMGASLILTASSSVAAVGSAQFLIGVAGAFLAPLIAAITMGIVGKSGFDRQFGRNQSFNAAGNVFTALLLAGLSYKFGPRIIFLAAGALGIPTLLSVSAIDANSIDYARSRGAAKVDHHANVSRLGTLVQDKVLLAFLIAAFLFHLANAAMLPELGEMLSKNNARTAAPFMSACVIVTQLVITIFAAWVGRKAGTIGRKPLLLAGFGVLPIRGVLYTLTHVTTALIAIQVLDGVANCIFGVVSILVVADRTRGTGRFNLAQGALATMVGIGAALSNTLGGQLVQHYSFNASFLGLSVVAVLAGLTLWFAVPETLQKEDERGSDTTINSHLVPDQRLAG
ncbi:MAG TPA: MFS transporter, partial [Candidatus Angelobacter sp.]|nr:MFS transporter [Candidatus Angelobacter sp.]